MCILDEPLMVVKTCSTIEIEFLNTKLPSNLKISKPSEVTQKIHIQHRRPSNIF